MLLAAAQILNGISQLDGVLAVFRSEVIVQMLEQCCNFYSSQLHHTHLHRKLQFCLLKKSAMRVQLSETRCIKANSDICCKEAYFSCVQNLMSSAFLSIVLQGEISLFITEILQASQISTLYQYFSKEWIVN